MGLAAEVGRSFYRRINFEVTEQYKQSQKQTVGIVLDRFIDRELKVFSVVL
jgi:hypothetical protein